MSVKRYECGMTNAPTEYQSPTMHHDANGGYVSYEYYAALEARCAALAAENAELDNFIASSCFVYAGELGYWPAIDHSPEIPVTNQLSLAESRFLTDVMTAAGLLSCGKRDKQLAQRLADFCVSKRKATHHAQLRKGVQS